MGTTDAEGEVLEVLALDPSGIDEGNFELLACSPRLRGGFVYVNFQPYILTDFEDREDKDAHRCYQYPQCICCAPFCIPLTLQCTMCGWLCCPCGFLLVDDDNPDSTCSSIANLCCCYSERWDFCAALHIFCPCCNISLGSLKRRFGDRSYVINLYMFLDFLSRLSSCWATEYDSTTQRSSISSIESDELVEPDRPSSPFM
eukprot:jgi/Bigna1/65121/fgenesh1_kg.98_\